MGILVSFLVLLASGYTLGTLAPSSAAVVRRKAAGLIAGHCRSRSTARLIGLWASSTEASGSSGPCCPARDGCIPQRAPPATVYGRVATAVDKPADERRREIVMTPLMDALLDRLRFVHDEARKVLSGLPGEALDWIPAPGMNSLCATVVHLLGAERYCLEDIVSGSDSGRDRAAEFKSSDVGIDELIRRLVDADEYAERVFAGIDPEHLDEKRLSRIHGREFSGAYGVTHAVEHGALHLGHLQIIRQMWESAHTTEPAGES